MCTAATYKTKDFYIHKWDNYGIDLLKSKDLTNWTSMRALAAAQNCSSVSSCGRVTM